MAYTGAWNVVPGEVATAVKMSQLGANDDYLKGELDTVTPTGSIVAFAGSTVPAGWLLCAGGAYNRSTYANLFSLIGGTYGGGNGSTTFNVPDLRQRVPVGRHTGVSYFNALNKKGGASTVKLTSSQMPSHTHSVSDPGHRHSTQEEYGATPNSNYNPTKNLYMQLTRRGYGFKFGAVSYAKTGVKLNNTGGNGSHNNLQPYITLNYIIKT